MGKALLLVLFLFCSFAFAQKEEPAQAIKFSEAAEEAQGEDLRFKVEEFIGELKNKSDLRGAIITWGLPKDVQKRTLEIAKFLYIKSCSMLS